MNKLTANEFMLFAYKNLTLNEYAPAQTLIIHQYKLGLGNILILIS